MDLPLEVIGDLAESRFCTIIGEEALSQGAKERAGVEAVLSPGAWC